MPPSFERICQVVHEITGVPAEDITAESTAAQLYMDSLDLCEIVMSLEEEFDILVDNEECIMNIADLVRCVETQFVEAQAV